MIPVNITALSPKAKRLLAQCIETSWISGEGSFVTEFEKSFAQYLGVKHAVAVNSGTSALHLALLALRLQPGDEVIVPASTIAACYFAIWYWGGVAVPVDVELTTYNLDPDLIEAAITPKTKAIMVVHLFGRPAAMAAIQKIARKHHLSVIEDAAEAHGAMIENQKVGSIGTVGCFSFYANKLVTTGEGGMVVTNSQRIAQRVRRLKSLNHLPARRFTHAGIGFSLALSNLQAAVGLAQLEGIEKAVRQKQAMAKLYNQELADVPGLVLPAPYELGRQVYWMYAVRIEAKKFGCSRDALQKKLLQKYKIQTRSFFFPPKVAFKAMGKFQTEQFPIAEQIGKEGLYLPSGTGQSKQDFLAVAAAIKKIAAQLR
jgi:perosamine synthetase